MYLDWNQAGNDIAAEYEDLVFRLHKEYIEEPYQLTGKKMAVFQLQCRDLGSITFENLGYAFFWEVDNEQLSYHSLMESVGGRSWNSIQEIAKETENILTALHFIYPDVPDEVAEYELLVAAKNQKRIDHYRTILLELLKQNKNAGNGLISSDDQFLIRAATVVLAKFSESIQNPTFILPNVEDEYEEIQDIIQEMKLLEETGDLDDDDLPDFNSPFKFG